ncbi:MAG: deoxyribonuclease IV [Chloroflexi bacterium]|nr:deoxyribonuclease IV [Chloroflexota bacterium]
MRIGAHVSTAGGLDKAIDRAKELGAEAIQCFCSSPQGWAFKPVPPGQAKSFSEKARAADVQPVFLHGIYLVNLGAESQENLTKGIDSLVNYTTAASAMGAQGVIFHPGSHKGVGYEGVFRQTVASLKEVLARSPRDVWLIIENSAGMGSHIGSKFEEIGRILRALEDPRLKVCLDTQHLFAAGHPVADRPGLEKTMQEFDRAVGLASLVAVHANDSKVPFASGVDRHENIGQGAIGLAGFEVILAHPAFRHVPFLLEVPGFDNKGPDRANVDILKAVRAKVGVGA